MKVNIKSILIKILTIGLLLVPAYYIGVVGIIFAYFTIPSKNGVSVLGLLYGLAVLYLIICIFSKTLQEKAKKGFIAAGIFMAALFTGFLSYDLYMLNIPTLSESLYGANLNEYQAYEGSKVAVLKEGSTLQFEDNLPVIDCATALYPVASAFVQAVYPPGEYHRSTPLAISDPVYVGCSGTSLAYIKLISGEADIIFAAEPSEEQLAAAMAAGVELTFTPIGKEAFVFFVNNKNPVASLTVEQIKRIYSGDIENWQDVGGKNTPILAFQRNKNSGSQTALLNMMDGTPLMDAPQDDIVIDMGGMVENVSNYKNYKNAIGFSFRFYATEMVDSGQIHLLQINHVYPDKTTIANNTYPFTSEFYAVTAGTDNPNVAPFIQWILSPQGQFLIDETGYVGLE